MYRNRTHHYKYERHLAQRRQQNKHPIDNCMFCDSNEIDDQIIEQTKYFKIIRNKYPYNIWDQQRVTDHLMLVPHAHTDAIASLTQEARLEFIKQISQFEEKGYHVYARATKSAMKSIPHQHTHLIKCVGKPTKMAFYLLKPYINFQR